MRLECLVPMYLLYSSLLAIGFLISIPYWAFQMLRHGKYGSGLGERLGRVAGRLEGQELGWGNWGLALFFGEGEGGARIFSGPPPRIFRHRGGVLHTIATRH